MKGKGGAEESKDWVTDVNSFDCDERVPFPLNLYASRRSRGRNFGIGATPTYNTHIGTTHNIMSPFQVSKEPAIRAPRGCLVNTGKRGIQKLDPKFANHQRKRRDQGSNNSTNSSQVFHNKSTKEASPFLAKHGLGSMIGSHPKPKERSSKKANMRAL